MFLGYHSGFETYLQLKQNPQFQSYLQVLRDQDNAMYLNAR